MGATIECYYLYEDRINHEKSLELFIIYCIINKKVIDKVFKNMKCFRSFANIAPNTHNTKPAITGLLLAVLFLFGCAAPIPAAITPAPTSTAAPFAQATAVPTPTPAPTPFSLLWLSDTQDMSFNYPKSLAKMGKWVAANRDAYNIVQVVSTGDAVEHGANPWQWENYDACLACFADIPYFSIAGNHEIGVNTNDYTAYLRRPELMMLPNKQKFLCGRAAYTLFSAGGTDFIILGCGWLTEELAADWISNVLATYSDRNAILLFHSVVDARGNPTKVGKFILDNIVAPNRNVRIVLCGHVPGIHTRVETFDSDGDSIPDHPVMISMYNYQTVGVRNGQMRILTFDPIKRTLEMVTYSPVTNVFYRQGSKLDGISETNAWVSSFEEISIAVPGTFQ